MLPAHARARPLDLGLPADTLTAWMKLHTSLEETDLYYWYRCRIDAAQVGRPITPLVGYDTLYRFQVRPQPDGTFHVKRWEACIYTDRSTNAVLDRFVNPLTGAEVSPFHFKEGPMTFRYSLEKPYILDNPVIRRSAAPFLMDWTQVGDDLWVTNETFVDMPHPLPPTEFPETSSGPRLIFSNIAVLRGSKAELDDPAVRSAACRLSYQATSGWSPWLRMGGQPGHVVIRGQGAKLGDPALIPAASRAAFERIHPEMFNRDPWADKRIMLLDFAKAHGR